MLRIGQIDYANCVPIFTALRERHAAAYRYIPGTPAELNALLHAGEIDLCPSSSIEYARHADQYLLLPDLSISSVGPVQSVMLFSRVPLPELTGAVVGLSGQSATSVILLQILLRRYYSVHTTFQTTSGQDLTPLVDLPAVLLIGDAALRGVKSGGAPYVYDLGSLWYEQTGLPFVFALWMVRRDAVVREPAAVAACTRHLLAAKEQSRCSYRAIAHATQPQGLLSVDELVEYWELISYDLSAAHVAGVERFFADAVQIGALEKTPAIRFIH